MTGRESISSAANPKLRRLRLLQEKSALREKEGAFTVEGRREVQQALQAGFRLRTLVVCPALFDGSLDLQALEREALILEVPPALYERTACRGGTEGVMAEFESRPHPLSALRLPEHPLVIVLEGVEKPGNIGAVLRSADAAGADALLLCDCPCDLYNPNLIRSSLGAVFTVPVAVCSSAPAIAFLQERRIDILTAQLQDSVPYYDSDMTRSTALVIGAESTGLTPLWRQAAQRHIRIPMAGRMDSLNASVSAAVLLFEAVRQRRTA